MQRLSIEKYDWDDDVPESIVKQWKVWFQLLGFLSDTSLARYYFEGSIPPSPQDHIIYQLHGFSDALKCGYGSVVYLRRRVNRVATVAVKGKYRVGRIAKVFSQIHQGKPLVRRAKIAVTEFDSKNDLYKVEHIYRDISRIAPVGGLGQ